MCCCHHLLLPSPFVANRCHQVLSSRDVLSNLKDERTKRKKELTNQEKVGKKEFQRLQSLLTTASGKVHVTKAHINQKKKERNELDQNKKNVRENIRTNFPRSVEAEKKKKENLTMMLKNVKRVSMILKINKRLNPNVNKRLNIVKTIHHSNVVRKDCENDKIYY
jgi:hypothetical protein